MINKYKEILKTKKDDSYVYLIQSINDYAGFYYHEGHILFMSKVGEEEKRRFSKIETDNLTAVLNVKIKAVNEEDSFIEDDFNMLYYKGDYSEQETKVFESICNLYVENIETISFFNFFQSIRDLFSKSSEKRKLDAIGLFGELTLLFNAYENHGINLSPYWLISGENSKFDYSFETSFLEVKTTSSFDRKFKLKHEQIFETPNVFIGTISIEKSEAGITLSELINKIKSTNEFKKNLNFMINLENLVLKTTFNKEIKYKLKDIRVYDVKKIVSIEIMSDNVNNIVYDYNFADINYLEFAEFLTDKIQFTNKQIK